MGKTINNLFNKLFNVQDPRTVSPASKPVFTKAELENLKAELLTLLEQAAPSKQEIYGSEIRDHESKGYNQAIDDYLASIRRIFK